MLNRARSNSALVRDLRCRLPLPESRKNVLAISRREVSNSPDEGTECLASIDFVWGM
jgi:hypothetical protein